MLDSRLRGNDTTRAMIAKQSLKQHSRPVEMEETQLLLVPTPCSQTLLAWSGFTAARAPRIIRCDARPRDSIGGCNEHQESGCPSVTRKRSGAEDGPGHP